MGSGSFTAGSGVTASGFAAIHESSPGSYDLFLGAITMPNETGLVIVIRADGAIVSQFALAATSGSRNYLFSLATPPSVWQRVDIHSTRNNVDYAQAVFVH